ncbi:MAG: hypothetical protein GY801_33395 [bacterium]|nr:hypothetical protein [bacterium]
MKTNLFAIVSDSLRGLFFSGQASELSSLVETLNDILESCKHGSGEQTAASLSERDVRRFGIKTLIRPLSDVQSRIKNLLAASQEKNAHIAGLEDAVAEMKHEISELVSSVKIQEEQLQERQLSEQNHVIRQQELESILSELVDVLEKDSCQSIVPDNVSEDIQGLAQAINSSFLSLYDRFALRSRQQESEKSRLVAALQQVARGEIPGNVSDETSSEAEAMTWIGSAAITLQEIYAGNSSVAATIQVSMEMLFTIAQELADGAAQQMKALQELQETVAQISQNTVKMADQTDETAKVAREIHQLAESLMNEAGEMTSAVQESYKNIEDINELMDRSSLLALNARIIAAQAGEHGRAFAVVAEAIKDLSTQTDIFLQLITVRVQMITISTTNVHEGVQRIAESMGAVQQNSVQIASGTHEYSVSTQQITASVKHILSRARYSALLAKQLSSMAQRISIALEQLAELTQFFEQHRGTESDMYRSGDTGERSSAIQGIATVKDLQKKRLAAIFINRGPADQIHEYHMQQEAERQHLQLRIYSGENNARLGFQIAEKLMTNDKIDILFWQVTNNLTLHKILYLAEQRHVLVIPFCRGGNVTKEHVPFQTLTQHYEEGHVAAECVPPNSSVYAVLGPEHLSIANTRAQGFLWNLPDGSRCIGKAHGDWTANEASILMKSFLDEHGQEAFNVIYGINDTSAFGAIGACLEWILLELSHRNAFTWTEKFVIGTDVSDEMLQCMHAGQGRAILGKMLEKIMLLTARENTNLTLSKHPAGWAVRWENEREAIFGIRDGQISVQIGTVTTIIIKEMVTVSHSTFCDDAGNPIGVGAMAIKHLIDCVQHPGQPPYLLFSQEQRVTKDTPEATWKTLRYVLTDTHTQWRNEHVMSISPQDEFVRIGELS